MPIKIVVNGYFRSGTTFMWDYLKIQLKRYNYICFYECLHPKLSTYIRREHKQKEKHPLHGKYLLQEYTKLGDDFLNKVLLNHPNYMENGIYNERAFKDFFDVFNDLEQSILIQENRAHFFLDVFFKDYNAKVIHIIRHPLNILSSIEKVYSANRSFTKRFIKRLFKSWMIRNYFKVFKEYHWIVNYTGYPYMYYDDWAIKYFRKNNFFDKFIVVWIISNYYAIKSIEKNAGLVIVYEQLLNNPKKIQLKLSKYLQIKLGEFPKIIKNNYFKFSKTKLQKVNKIVSLYRIEEEFDYVIQKVKDESGVTYF